VEMNAQKRAEVSMLDGIDGPLTCSSVYHLRGAAYLVHDISCLRRAAQIYANWAD